jgi:hypothetical protein
MSPKNAFYVLGLSPDASSAEIEREGRKILGMIELGLAQGKTYSCPLGTFDRDATMVREAMARLRDPKIRLREATIAGLLVGDTKAVRDEPDAPVLDAFLIGGYRGF